MFFVSLASVPARDAREKRTSTTGACGQREGFGRKSSCRRWPRARFRNPRRRASHARASWQERKRFDTGHPALAGSRIHRPLIDSTAQSRAQLNETHNDVARACLTTLYCSRMRRCARSRSSSRMTRLGSDAQRRRSGGHIVRALNVELTQRPKHSLSDGVRGMVRSSA
jgi:hypothetical protein